MSVLHCLIFLCVSIIANSVTLACPALRLFTKPVQEHGHHVSVRVEGKHLCSGSIISSRFILTSHGCIYMYAHENVSVVAGTNSLESGGDQYVIEKVFVPELLRHDIALLRTEKNIIFHNGINKIKIANAADYDDDYEVSVTGWEYIPDDKTRNNYILQHRPAKIYDKEACRKNFYTSGIDDCMCIYDPSGLEICNAEKGGAIVANGFQIGIYTQEPTCYNSSQGRVHTSVYPYKDWIQKVTHSGKNTTPNPSSAPNPSSTLTPPSHVDVKKFEHDAPEGAYPYHVSIGHNNEHVCSGSIINKRYILTSINCIMRFAPWSLRVKVGINSLNETGAIHEVDVVTPHRNRAYDVALIHLTTDIQFNARAKSIHIVKSGKRYRDSQKVILTGWQRRNSCGPISDKLQHKILYTMSYGKCQQLIPFHDPMYMCSMEKSSHTCNMDYGGPIISEGYQIALNPAYVGCGEKFDPLLHFPLYKVANWIKSHSSVRS